MPAACCAAPLSRLSGSPNDRGRCGRHTCLTCFVAGGRPTYPRIPVLPVRDGPVSVGHTVVPQITRCRGHPRPGCGVPKQKGFGQYRLRGTALRGFRPKPVLHKPFSSSHPSMRDSIILILRRGGCQPLRVAFSQIFDSVSICLADKWIFCSIRLRIESMNPRSQSLRLDSLFSQPSTSVRYSSDHDDMISTPSNAPDQR